jgi:hypothetical protein
VEKNAPNIVIVDSAGRAILGAVLAGSGPKIGLPIASVSRQIFVLDCRQRTYVIHQRIGCDIVIAGQFSQCQALATFCRRRALSRSLWGHDGSSKKLVTARYLGGRQDAVS